MVITNMWNIFQKLVGRGFKVLCPGIETLSTEKIKQELVYILNINRCILKLLDISRRDFMIFRQLWIKYDDF